MNQNKNLLLSVSNFLNYFSINYMILKLIKLSNFLKIFWKLKAQEERIPINLAQSKN